MSDKKFELPNLLDFFRIGYKKKTPEQLKYASFNRRSYAFMIDAIILMLLIGPLVDAVFKAVHGEFPLDMAVFLENVRQIPSAAEQREYTVTQFRESGALQYRLDNTLWLLTVLFVLTGLCWHKWGATPGKLVMHIRVVDVKSETLPTINQIMLRLAGYLISATFALIGFFWIGLDKRKQGWHDKLAETVVITVPFKKDKFFSKSTPEM